MSRVDAELPHVRMAEWECRHIERPTLTDADRLLVKQLAVNGRVRIDELAGGARISATSWVGIIRFSGFELDIVPKLAGESLGVVDMIDFTSGLDCLKRLSSDRSIQCDGSNLLDLIALLFVQSCESLCRGGLLADYVEVEDDLPVLRGRLLADRQVLQRFGRIDRLACRFDEHATNIAENQLLLAALTACAPRVSHPGVAMRARRMLNLFAEVCSLDGFDHRTTTFVYNRLNEPYRDAHNLARTVLDGLGVDDLYAAKERRCFSFLIDMNGLFEEFVYRWLSWLLRPSSFRAVPQRRDRTILWDADHDRPYAAVIPDIAVYHVDDPNRLLPIDSKYKLYDAAHLSPADVYQTFLYAFAYGAGIAAPVSLLIYPTLDKGGTTARLHVRDTAGRLGGELIVIGIHIPTALAEARADRRGATGIRFAQRISTALRRSGGVDSFLHRPGLPIPLP